MEVYDKATDLEIHSIYCHVRVKRGVVVGGWGGGVGLQGFLDHFKC